MQRIKQYKGLFSTLDTAEVYAVRMKNKINYQRRDNYSVVIQMIVSFHFIEIPLGLFHRVKGDAPNMNYIRK